MFVAYAATAYRKIDAVAPKDLILDVEHFFLNSETSMVPTWQ
jgi:hypothetical protein